jgi:hypothetical protein
VGWILHRHGSVSLQQAQTCFPRSAALLTDRPQVPRTYRAGPLRWFGASHFAQLDHPVDVGAGLVPALSGRDSIPEFQGTHEGRPYASWFGDNVHAGDGKPSPQ